MRNNRRIGPLLAWATAAVIGLGIAGGAAWASPSPSSPPSGPAAQAGARTEPAAQSSTPFQGRHPRDGALAKRLAGRLGAVQHGEFVVRTRDGFKTVEVQRGTVTAASTSSLSVRSPDGFTVTYPITAKSRVRVDGKQADASSLKPGQRVGVLAEKQGSGLVTLFVRAFDPGKAPGHQPGTGGSARSGTSPASPSPSSLVRSGWLTGSGNVLT